MSTKSTSSDYTKCEDKNDTQLLKSENLNTRRKSNEMCDHAIKESDSSDSIESDSAYNTDNNEDRNETTDDDIAPEGAVSSTLQKIFGIEWVVGLFGLSIGLVAVINLNLTIEKVCRINFNFSSTICDNLLDDKYNYYQNKVQTRVTEISMYSTILASIPILFISLFVGPLSDRYGRKLAIVPPLMGIILGHAIYLANVILWYLPAEYLLIGSLYSLFGGFTSLFVGIYSYIGDSTSVKHRTTKYSLMDASFSVCMSIGVYLSGPLFNYGGYKGIYAVSITLLIIDLFIVIFCLKGSTISAVSRGDPWSGINPIKTFRSVMKRRSEYKRLKIVILFVTIIGYVTMFCCDLDYIYARRVLSWDEQIYTKASAASTIVKCISSVVILPLLSSYYEMADHNVGLLAALSLMIGQLVIALARTSGVYITGLMLGGLSSMFVVSCKSILSKQVDQNELGQLYSIQGSLENLMPLMMNPLMTSLYNATVHDHPSTVFYLRTMIAGCLVFSFVSVARLDKRVERNNQDREISETTPLLIR